MDAKEVLALLKKHHFWVISGVVLIVALVCWYMASNSLAAATATQENIVKGKFTQVETIPTVADHPNASFEKAVNDEHNKLKGLTLTAWQRLYNQQRKELAWPAKSLGPDFGQRAEKAGRTGTLSDADLEVYRNFIRLDFPRLFDIVKVRNLVKVERGNDNAKRPGPAGAPGNFGGGNQKNAAEWRGLVAWDEKQRLALQQQYYWPKRPTTLQVWYAQEDLWVYQALLNVIKRTNGAATEHIFVPIKRIDSLDVGQAASGAMIGAAGGGPGAAAGAAAVGGAPAAAGGVPGAAGGVPGAADGAPGADKSADLNSALTNNRYVDAKGKPIASGANPPFAEFNMIPIRMVLSMDQNKIPDLLVECANSPLSIEVRRVRVNPGSGITLEGGQGAMNNASATGPAAGGPGAGGPGGAGPGAGGPGAGGPANINIGGGGRAGGAGAEAELAPGDVKVEIVGCVYLFNPPDVAKLGTGAGNIEAPVIAVEGDAAPIDGAVPLEGEAAPPPPVNTNIDDEGAPPPAAAPADNPGAAPPPAPPED